jgi:uncharacterized protein YdaU (DUF1376 family)
MSGAPVNYYEHHLGDYARDASHLSMLEEGAYRRLIDAYYARESPLPLDISQCKKLARVTRTPAEHRAVEYVLAAFFVKEADGYHQKRCDEEIQRFAAKREAAKASANARWAHSDRNANASADGMRTHMRTQSEGNALQSPVSNPQTPEEDNPTHTLPAGREGPSLRDQGKNRRALGTNPRALRDNPRALGTNPRAHRDEHKAEVEEARLAWSELIATGGAKRDHRIQGALDAIGGWTAVRMRTEHDGVRLQRAFCEAYLARGESVRKNGAHQSLDPDDLREREEAARADR